MQRISFSVTKKGGSFSTQGEEELREEKSRTSAMPTSVEMPVCVCVRVCFERCLWRDVPPLFLRIQRLMVLCLCDHPASLLLSPTLPGSAWSYCTQHDNKIASVLSWKSTIAAFFSCSNAGFEPSSFKDGSQVNGNFPVFCWFQTVILSHSHLFMFQMISWNDRISSGRRQTTMRSFYGARCCVAETPSPMSIGIGRPLWPVGVVNYGPEEQAMSCEPTMNHFWHWKPLDCYLLSWHSPTGPYKPLDCWYFFMFRHCFN